jgi:hypothetical protein
MGTNLATEIIREPKIADQRLFQAIIIQAFEDCLYTLGGKNEAYHKKDAHEWFINRNKDFEEICYMAGLEPDMVHTRYKWCLKEKIIVFTEVQRYWIEYKNEYANYRACDSKEERRSVKKRIDMITAKLKQK